MKWSPGVHINEVPLYIGCPTVQVKVQCACATFLSNRHPCPCISPCSFLRRLSVAYVNQTNKWYGYNCCSHYTSYTPVFYWVIYYFYTTTIRCNEVQHVRVMQKDGKFGFHTPCAYNSLKELVVDYSDCFLSQHDSLHTCLLFPFNAQGKLKYK